MMEVKTCKQCGEIKPLDQFRRYYGGRKGTYTMCKQCERINAREKYLMNKGENASVDELEELDKIHQLWSYQLSLGLQPPSTSGGRRTALKDDLDGMLKKYSEMSDNVNTEAYRLSGTYNHVTEMPMELAKWFTEKLDREPDYYFDEVYEKLKETYRPVLRIDQQTMMPVYDDKYKTVLDRILDRFYEYEDSYYEQEA